MSVPIFVDSRESRSGLIVCKNHKEGCFCQGCKNKRRENIGSDNPMYGRHHSRESNEENRKKHLGKSSWNCDIHGEEYSKHFDGGVVWNKGKTKENNTSLRVVSLKMLGRTRPDMKDPNKNFRIKNKGKTYEEIFGVEKAKKMKEGMYLRRGDKHPRWNGGKFGYYGQEWHSERNKILNDVITSEISGCTGTLNVHHIFPLKNFLRKAIELFYECFIEEKIEIESFRILPYDMIPSSIFEEANRRVNLIVVTVSEHRKYEGMPPTFFESIRSENNDNRRQP